MERGEEIKGYVLEDKLGQGGMAEVWQVKLKSTGDQLAVKVLLPEYSANDRVRKRFEREGHIQLVHPNVVPVLQLEEFEGRPALIMPLYLGGSLEKRIRRTDEEKRTGTGKPLALKEALAISREILGALDFANQSEIIHRDVKPDNILFDNLGHAHLADFGIALDMKRLKVTEAGGDLGTAAYISPEQVRNPSKVDHRTDVYSFGCCLFDMLAGRPPFISDEPDASAWSFNLRLAHVNDEPPPLQQFNPDVSMELNDLVMTSLAKLPDQRWPGCGEFARQLRLIEQQLTADAPKIRTFQAGDQIEGYVFEKKLGQGGMAEVWQVRQANAPDVLAAKILVPEYCANPRIRARFEREGHIRLEHPNIVPVLRLVEFRGRPAMVMPLYTGGSLEARIRKTSAEEASGIGKPLPIEESFAIAYEILSALDFANQQQIIHRDVKPDNILFDNQGHAYVADFGIALDMKRIAITEAGGELGTASYISPEQVRNPRKVDHRADVYSFGCCLYDMLAGRPPFISDETDDVAWSFNLRLAHVKENPRPVRELNPSVSQELNDLVMKCIAKGADQRFPGCGEVARQLRIVQQQQRRAPWLVALQRNSRRAVVAVLCAFVLLGGVLGGRKLLQLWQSRPTPTKTEVPIPIPTKRPTQPPGREVQVPMKPPERGKDDTGKESNATSAGTANGKKGPAAGPRSGTTSAGASIGKGAGGRARKTEDPNQGVGPIPERVREPGTIGDPGVQVKPTIEIKYKVVDRDTHSDVPNATVHETGTSLPIEQMSLKPGGHYEFEVSAPGYPTQTVSIPALKNPLILGIHRN